MIILLLIILCVGWYLGVPSSPLSLVGGSSCPRRGWSSPSSPLSLVGGSSCHRRGWSLSFFISPQPRREQQLPPTRLESPLLSPQPRREQQLPPTRLESPARPARPVCPVCPAIRCQQPQDEPSPNARACLQDDGSQNKLPQIIIKIIMIPQQLQLQLLLPSFQFPR